MTCRFCHSQQPDQWRFCLRCGAMLVVLPGAVPCAACGRLVAGGVRFCSACGRAMAAAPAARPPAVVIRSRRQSAIVLGAIFPGAGQAYNGQTWKGILVLATSFLLVPWVLGCVFAGRVADQVRPAPSGGRLVFSLAMHALAAIDLLLLTLLILTLGRVIT